MKTRIMIVDDDQDLRDFMKIILETEGYEISEAASLATLRQAFARAAPAAVILDLSLPDGNGVAVLPELKQKWPTAKVVILTGYGMVDVAKAPYQLDSELFLQSKPFGAETLKGVLKRALAPQYFTSQPVRPEHRPTV